MGNNFCLPWDEVENAIKKETKWLKDIIPVRRDQSPFAELERSKHFNDCECDYRKIALLIIKGMVKAKEIKGDKLWEIDADKIRSYKDYHHGKDWHQKMMNIIDNFFSAQNYEVIVEPYLNWGRADLGVYRDDKNNLFVEVDTTSIHKLWLNLCSMKESVFLLVISENKAIEFQT